jgi:hypothetical protein
VPPRRITASKPSAPSAPSTSPASSAGAPTASKIPPSSRACSTQPPRRAPRRHEARLRGPHVFEGWEYYCSPRAFHPRSAKSLTWTSVDHITTFDAFHTVDLISPRPLLMIVGRNAMTAWMSVEALVAREPTRPGTL